jgi:Thymidylate synthase complementing protein
MSAVSVQARRGLLVGAGHNRYPDRSNPHLSRGCSFLLSLIFGASSVIRVLLSAPFCLQVWPSSLFICRPESWDRAPIEWQRLTPSHGYITPKSIIDISAGDIWTEAMERAAAFYHILQTAVSPLVAQYVIPFAYKVRFYMQLNAREAFHLLDSIGIPILRLPSRPHDTKARWGEEGTCCGPMMGWM